MRRASQCVFGTSFSVSVVPVLKDNFSYVIHDFATNTLAVVDVSEVDPVESYIQREIRERQNHPSAQLTAVLTTHKHWDHCGGNKRLQELHRGRPLQFYGSEVDQIPCCTHPVTNGSSFAIGALKVDVFTSACHTRGHVLYRVYDPATAQHGRDDTAVAALEESLVASNPTEAPTSASALFTGDTFFIAGIGAFFEGDAADMCRNVQTLTQQLPNATRIFPGHEYTMNFMGFSAQVAKEKGLSPACNTFIARKTQQFKELLQAGHPTVPSTVGEEKVLNLFMRVYDAELQSKFNKAGDPVGLMDVLYSSCP